MNPRGEHFDCPQQFQAQVNDVISHLQAEQLTFGGSSGQEISSVVEVTDSGVAIIAVDGMLVRYPTRYTASYPVIQADLASLAVQQSVIGVVLLIDSPGGQTMQLMETLQLIDAFPKPIVAFTSGWMTSCAYRLGCHADGIYATHSANVGGIGTKWNVNDWSANFEQSGIRVVSESTGPLKNFQDMGLPVTEEQQQFMRDRVQHLQGEFVQSLVTRGMTADQISAVSSGGFWEGSQAVGMGLVDGLQTLQSVIAMVESGSFGQAVSSRVSRGGVIEMTRQSTGISQPGDLNLVPGQSVAGQQAAAQSTPAQQSPVQPTPAQQAPAQQAPAQQAPAQQAPAQPTPAQQAPAQQAPAQQAPAQPTRAQPTPAQPTPAQPTPAQPTPAQPTPAQPTPAQQAPAQQAPAQPTPAQQAASQQAPVMPPADRPATLAELQQWCRGASSDFYIQQMSAGASVPVAMVALQEQTSQQLSQATGQPLPGQQSPGVGGGVSSLMQFAGTPGTAGGTGGDPLQSFEDLVQQACTNGVSRAKAFQSCLQQHPEAYDRYRQSLEQATEATFDERRERVNHGTLLGMK